MASLTSDKNNTSQNYVQTGDGNPCNNNQFQGQFYQNDSPYQCYQNDGQSQFFPSDSWYECQEMHFQQGNEADETQDGFDPNHESYDYDKESGEYSRIEGIQWVDDQKEYIVYGQNDQEIGPIWQYDDECFHTWRNNDFRRVVRCWKCYNYDHTMRNCRVSNGWRLPSNNYNNFGKG